MIVEEALPFLVLQHLLSQLSISSFAHIGHRLVSSRVALTWSIMEFTKTRSILVQTQSNRLECKEFEIGEQITGSIYQVSIKRNRII